MNRIIASVNEIKITDGVLRVAVSQSGLDEVLPLNPEDKIVDMTKTVSLAALHHVDLVVFPELYLSGYSLSALQVQEYCLSSFQTMLTAATELALQHKIHLVVSSPESRPEGGYYNCAFYINAQGKIAYTYRKRMIFGDYERSLYSSAQEHSQIFTINNVKIGILICYDSDFPEHYRQLALAGAEVVVIPTAGCCYERTAPQYAEANVDSPKICLPAYSLAHNLFIAYANRSTCELNPSFNIKNQFRGNSLITDPHGGVLVQGRFKESSLLIADLDKKSYQQLYPDGDLNRDYAEMYC